MGVTGLPRSRLVGVTGLSRHREVGVSGTSRPRQVGVSAQSRNDLVGVVIRPSPHRSLAGYPEIQGNRDLGYSRNL